MRLFQAISTNICYYGDFSKYTKNKNIKLSTKNIEKITIEILHEATFI